MKATIFVGSSLNDLRAFPEEARREAGFEIDQLQRGEEPSDWRPMSQIGAGVREIRIHAGGAFRIIYVAAFDESVYVLHAFRKKTQTTSKRDIDLASERLKQLLAARKRKKTR
ncbi:MAG: type II toxin-antitoxin system RelE/ParE family toxin [Rudaea sp.]